MTTLSQERPEDRVLVVTNSELWALLVTRLQNILPGVSVESTDNLVKAAELFRNYSYRWLVIDQRCPEERGGVEAQSTQSGVDFARGRLEKHRKLRALVLTETPWDHLGWHLSKRLSIVPRRDLLKPVLADTIHAAEADANYLAPTVVQARLRCERTATDQQSGKGACVLEFDRCSDGPMRYVLERDRSRLRPQRLGNFDDISERFQKITDAGPELTTKAELVEAAHRVGEPLEKNTGFLSTFLEINDRAIRQLTGSGDLETPSAVVPFHLHILADAETMALRFDLALPTGDGRHLCDRLPVTWRLRTKHPTGGDDERDHNVTDYRHFKAIHSCLTEFPLGERRVPGLAEAREHTEALVTQLGLPLKQSLGVQDVGSLSNALAAKTTRECAYVFTHGLADRDPDQFSVIVGPTLARWACARASQLTAPEGMEARRFIYFNCCWLGTQYTTGQSQSSYYGGFAEAALQEGVCREIICNRSEVSSFVAARLAAQFYRQKASTVHARAAALWNARRKVRDEMKRDPDGTNHGNDLTWLAPIHVWSLEP